MNKAKKKRQDKAIIEAYCRLADEKKKDISTKRKESLQRFIDINGKDALVLAEQESRNGITVCTDFSWAMDAEKPEQLDNARVMKAETLMEVYIMQEYALSKLT